MGFFKKIGSAIKKNVSFKNLVKATALTASFVPGIGGIAKKGIDFVTKIADAKKKAKTALQQGDVETAKVYTAQAEQHQQEAIASTGKIVGDVAGASANMFGNAVMTGINDGLSQGVTNGAGQVGATFLSSTLKIWFQKNWKIVAGVGVGLIGIIWFLRSGGANRSSRARKSR